MAVEICWIEKAVKWLMAEVSAKRVYSCLTKRSITFSCYKNDSLHIYKPV